MLGLAHMGYKTGYISAEEELIRVQIRIAKILLDLDEKEMIKYEHTAKSLMDKLSLKISDQSKSTLTLDKLLSLLDEQRQKNTTVFFVDHINQIRGFYFLKFQMR